jgi:hypothetical protein
MPPSERTMLKAYRLQPGMAGAANVSGRWTHWSIRHQWSMRVGAWDAECDRVKRSRHLLAIEEMAEREVRLAQGFQNQIARRLMAWTEADTAKLSPTEMIKWFEIAARIERTAMGVPAEIVRGEMTGADNGSINVNIQSDDPIMDEDERDSRIVALLERARARRVDPQFRRPSLAPVETEEDDLESEG